MNESDPNNQASNNLNQQSNYANQPLFYVNQSNVETSSYAALQEGGWTKSDYQQLQGWA